MTSLTEPEFRRLLPHISHTHTEELLGTFSSLELDRLDEPETGLVMITVNDCYQHPFHLGEMLVTRAEVLFDGIPAHATVMGDNAEKALLAATFNAVLRHPQAETLCESFHAVWEPIARTTEDRVQEEQHVSATTRVAFENMAEEEEI